MGCSTASRIKAVALLLFAALAAAFMMPSIAHAQDSDKVVRVGWYDSSFNTIDSFGRRSGYAYEYQIKLSAYTGWTYEYVSGSWPELMRKLEAGEIDLMNDVSYTPEREGRMLYPELPMGSEEYCLFISPHNQEIDKNDYSTLNGKGIGVNEASIQAEFLADWMQLQGVQAEIVEVSTTEEESLKMVDTGELDAYVTIDSFIAPEQAVPVCKVGASDYYFVVSTSRPELLTDLNYAMSMIMDENPYFNQQMYEKHVKRAGANAFLPNQEVEWLSEHGTIRVGYQDNYLAFCTKDKTTGKLVGALKEYLDKASNCFANASFNYEAIAYPTAAAALDALKKGEVDCVFPANLSCYDAESLGVVTTSPMVSTDMYAVVRETNLKSFASKEHVVVAVNEGNPNYDSFLRDYFPDWNKVYFPTTDDCLKAVADNVADCVLVSNYRYSNIARTCEQNHLTSFTTNVDIDYSFAVASGDMEMYSVLTKAANLIPDTVVNSSMSRYAAEEAKITFTDFIMDNIGIVLAVIIAVLLVILAFMIKSMRAEKRAKELISATEIDSLTGLYNRGYFFEYANRMYQEHPETPMDAIVLNIERFHSVNALNGREFGDQVLRTLGEEILSFSNTVGGIAGRFQADRFDIYCPHGHSYLAIFNRLQGKLDDLSSNTSIQLRMGVMQWQEKLDPVQLFDRARTACNMACGNFSERLILFDERMREREMLEQRLMNDLRRALDSYEFEVHYQPKYDIQCDPPELVGAEALVRWHHPDLGVIPPEDFVPLFERSGRIWDLDKYVWQEAARRVARWREAFGVSIPVSVNLSRVDVFDQALDSTLESIIKQNGLEHDMLKLEVTESAYTEDAEQVIQVVEGLREAGFEVGMDDFGTGYSSLSMLSVLPIDFLKMDSAFIQGIEHSEKDVQMVALVLGIARTLKVPVVAEGVETEGQVKLLRDLGCEQVQGCFFSRPLHATYFEDAFITEKARER